MDIKSAKIQTFKKNSKSEKIDWIKNEGKKYSFGCSQNIYSPKYNHFKRETLNHEFVKF